MQQDQWSSQFGFLVASIGAAIGLGNRWRFSAVVGQNGGAYLTPYFIAAFLFGVPLMILEMSIGRDLNADVVTAFKRVRTEYALIGSCCSGISPSAADGAGDTTKPRAAEPPMESTMEISEQLLCLFSADVRETDDGEFVVDVPSREIETGSLEPGETYRVALVARDGSAAETDGADHSASRADDGPQPPVEPGEMRYVEIEDLGKQGDGIARVERGYVIIVPDTEVGERVKIEVTEVKSNFAVGEVVETAV